MANASLWIQLWHIIFDCGEHREQGEWYARCQRCQRAWLIEGSPETGWRLLQLPERRARFILSDKTAPGFTRDPDLP